MKLSPLMAGVLAVSAAVVFFSFFIWNESDVDPHHGFDPNYNRLENVEETGRLWDKMFRLYVYAIQMPDNTFDTVKFVVEVDYQVVTERHFIVPFESSISARDKYTSSQMSRLEVFVDSLDVNVYRFQPDAKLPREERKDENAKS